MMGIYTGNWLYIGWHLHMILGGVLTVGAVLFIIWSVKTLKPNELLNWAIILVIIGFIGVLLTAATGFRGLQEMMLGLEDRNEYEYGTIN